MGACSGGLVVGLGRGISARTCVASGLCPSLSYEEFPASSLNGRICTPVRACSGPGMFELITPTATTDRYCGSVMPCALGQYRSANATATSAQQCTNASICLTSEYEALALTPTSNRVCKPFCSQPHNIDLVLVLEASAIVGAQNYANVLQFASDIIGLVPITSGETRCV